MPKLDRLSENSLTPEIVSLISGAPLPGLADGPQCAETKSGILELKKTSHEFSNSLSEAGLWLLAGELDWSHSISQGYDSAEGSFWHGIMHRREGDFGNSKYWFRRVGKHHVHKELSRVIATEAESITAAGLPLHGLQDPNSLPDSLVNLCDEALASKKEWIPTLSTICWWEWQLLFASSQ